MREKNARNTSKAKKSRRANGEGSVYQKNGRWLGYITTGKKQNGSLERAYFSGTTKREVLEKMDAFKAKRLQENNRKVTKEAEELLCAPFREGFENWLYTVKKWDLAPSSYERYEGLFRNFLQHAPFACRPLAELTFSNCLEYYKDLADTQKVPVPTLKYLHDLIVFFTKYVSRQDSGFSFPQEPQMLQRLFRRLESLDSGRDSYFVLSGEEQQKLTRHLLRSEDSLDLLLLFALSTGLRVGEIQPLTFSDLDLEKNLVYVRKSLTREKVNERRVYKIKKPKTKNSERTVPLPSYLSKHLQKIWKKEQRRCLPADLVFASSKDQSYLPQRSILRRLQNLCQELEIPIITVHALRHCYATRLFEGGVAPKTVQALLGHADIETTMQVYTHVMPEKKEEAACHIDHLFQKAAEQKNSSENQRPA